MAITFDKLTKVIEIESPAIEITIQDLVNAIRDWQDELDNIETANILSAAGKEALGGGVSVGVTMTLLDGWKVAFEARAGPTYTQCTVSGGNLVSEDESNPIYPTAFTQIVVTASSSATTADLDAIQYSSYGGGISVDIINGQSGTDYPIGNQEFPVDNMVDAITIANSKGFKTLFIQESMTISTITMSDFHLIGRSHVNTVITMNTTAVCDGITIENANITGVLDGGTHITECSVGDITYVNGHIHHCGLYGTTILDGNEDAVIEDCFTIDHDNSPIIDMGGTGQDLALPNYSGIINIKNFNDATGEIGIGLSAGLVILESTITAGTIIVAGSGLLTDNSTGTASVNTDGLTNRELITKTTWDEVVIDTVSGETGTDFPIGTLNHPVDNLADAIIIATTNNIKKLRLHTNLTLTQSVAGYEIEGAAGIVLNIGSQSILGCIIRRIRLTGIMLGEDFFAQECSMYSLTNIAGTYDKCWLLDTTPISIASNKNILFNNCRSAVPGSDNPVLDYSNGNISLNNRAFSGGIKIINSTDINNVSTYEFVAGKFNFDNSNTNGYFAVRGVVDTTNIDDSGGATVVLTGASNAALDADAVWDETLADHLDVGSTGKALNDVSGGSSPEVIAAEVWSTLSSSHTGIGTFGGDLATKADIKSSASTSFTSATSGIIIHGTAITGTYTDTFSRNNVYWEIQEDATNGITIETIFNLPSDNNSAGVVNVFGRYIGVPTTTHYIELWAYNYETASFELLQEQYMPGGNTADSLYDFEYEERHIDRTNNNEVKIRLIHNTATYNNTHELYIDYMAVSSIKVITAGDIADAVWEEQTNEHASTGSFGEKVGKKLLSFIKYMGNK